MRFKIGLALILLNFVRISAWDNGLLNCEWYSNKLITNVLTFANLLDELFVQYKEVKKMDSVVHKAPFPAGAYSDKQKRAVFNLTFVKWAAELAHFRVIDGTEGNGRNWKVIARTVNDSVGFAYYDQSLGHKIADAFDRQIFSKEKEVAKKVQDQILQLTFSFAARVILCEIYDGNLHYHYNIASWQLKTLLTAYKKVAPPQKDSEQNESHGIFPFKLIDEIAENGKVIHRWRETLCPKAMNKYDNEQQQFIKNFQFIRRLSDFTLSHYQIHKVLDAIMNELDAQEEPPALYTFMAQSFMQFFFSPPNSPQRRSKLAQADCAFVNFGRELAKRLPYQYDAFLQYTKAREKVCGGDAHKKIADDTVSDSNTPSEGSCQLEMEMFKEPLWNYARVIGIDVANEYESQISLEKHSNKIKMVPLCVP